MKTVTLTNKQFVTLFEVCMSSCRGLLKEVRAYEMTFNALRQVSLEVPDLAEAVRILDVTLDASRVSPPLEEKMRLQFDELLEKFRQLTTESQTPEEVLEAFRKLTKTKWLN
jgi:hypothetical protein